jgi:osmotically-inducible protein OsmY
MNTAIPRDARLVPAIRERLTRAGIPLRHVDVSVTDGTASLAGWLPREADVSRAAEQTLLVGGVHTVENRLVSDERLYWRALGLLRRLGLEADVDVSVRDGILTLEGALSEPRAPAEVVAALAGTPGLRSLADRPVVAGGGPAPARAA